MPLNSLHLPPVEKINQNMILLTGLVFSQQLENNHKCIDPAEVLMIPMLTCYVTVVLPVMACRS